VAEAAIGIFGGSGFYSFLDEVEEVGGAPLRNGSPRRAALAL
jgi:hypothetical protein